MGFIYLLDDRRGAGYHSIQTNNSQNLSLKSIQGNGYVIVIKVVMWIIDIWFQLQGIITSLLHTMSQLEPGSVVTIILIGNVVHINCLTGIFSFVSIRIQ